MTDTLYCIHAKYVMKSKIEELKEKNKKPSPSPSPPVPVRKETWVEMKDFRTNQSYRSKICNK